jgi:hypothetical protein
MSIRASRGTRLLLVAALAWLGLALCAQAAHATYGKVQVAKINNGGNAADTFTFHPSLTPSASDFTLKGGDSSSNYSVECNIDRSTHPNECARWGYPALKFTEVAKAGYTLTDITCRFTQGTSTWGAAVTSSSPVKPASEVTKDLANGSVSLKVHWYEQVKCWFTNTKNTPPPPTGTIKVTKKLAPATDSGKFNLLIDGATKAANVGDGGTTGTQTVNTGAHTVGESAGTGTSLSNYNSSLTCVDKAHGGAADNDGSVQVDAADAWECVITNTRKTTPTPPTEPPTQTPPVTPPTATTPATAPQIAVSPARVVPGSAKMGGLRACPTTKVVAATVTGKRIVKVTFYVDGRKVKTLTKPNGKGGAFKLPMDVRKLAYGSHRVRAKVQFAKSSGTKAKTLRLSFSRCGGVAAQPKFTG